MPDPLQRLFGRPVFSGTGRTRDYFPSAPDLAYLQDMERPEYIPEDSGYDPSLNFENLVRQGYSEQDAAEVQRIRANLHHQAKRGRILTQSRQATDELAKIDPSRESFARDILGIFTKYPEADKDPSFLQKVGRLGYLSRMMPTKVKEKMFDPDAIKDPDIYKRAIDEGWDKMTEKQGARRFYDAAARKERRLKLIGMGITRDKLDELEKTGGLSDEAIAELEMQLKSNKSDRNLTPEQAKYMAEKARESAEIRQFMKTDEGKMAWMQQNLAGGDTKQTDFPSAAWSKAWHAAEQPNIADLELEAYRKLINLTPSQVGQASPVQSTETTTVAKSPDGVVVISSQAEYDALPNGARFRDSSGKDKIKGMNIK